MLSEIKNPLGQFQLLFSGALKSGLNTEFLALVRDDMKDMADRRLAVYQNNVAASLQNAIADLYPVVKKLLGIEFFNGCAKYYFHQEPLGSAAMVFLGKHFPIFLREFEHTQTMPWLGDMAEFELCLHRSFHAADDSTLTVSDLQNLDQEVLLKTRVSLRQDIQLFQSQYAITDIWSENQKKESLQQEVVLDIPCWSLIYREDYDVSFIVLSEVLYVFITLLSEGKAIGNALGECNDAFPLSDMAQLFSSVLQLNILCRIQE